jgi:predicted metal-dependent TIM-barrel fold hydrolase
MTSMARAIQAIDSDQSESEVKELLNLLTLTEVSCVEKHYSVHTPKRNKSAIIESIVNGTVRAKHRSLTIRSGNRKSL